METYEDHPWCPYGSQSGEEEDEPCHDPHLAKVRSRSNSRNRHRRRRSSFLVDELDMLMDKAATTIQATWRGYLTRKSLKSQQEAATIIQAAWRGFITREYLAMQQDQVPSWNASGHRRRTPSPASSDEGWQSRGRPSMDKQQAAVVIQANYRGYLTRRTMAQCQEAATTIQAHWRGYQTRQDLAREGAMRGHEGPVGEESSRRGPYARPHWQKVMVGEPDEWGMNVPRRSHEGRRREQGEPAKPKTCPRCGRCTAVRVLTGVGKGPPSESEVDESDSEGHSRPPSAHYRGRERSPASRSRDRLNPTRNCPSGPRMGCSTRSSNCSSGCNSGCNSGCSTGCNSGCQRKGYYPYQYGCNPASPGVMCPRYSVRPTRDCSAAAARSFSSTSLRHQRASNYGKADWLFDNYCTRPVGEGQRVFKTRKHMRQVVRAATLIQSFWRGWRARKNLRLQQEAATRIQSAYRGYKTRAYLTEAGVLSEGDTTD